MSDEMRRRDERIRELEREVEEGLIEIHDLKEGQAGGSEGRRIRDEKVEESIGDLIKELEEATKRENLLKSKIASLEAQVTGATAVKLSLQEEITQIKNSHVDPMVTQSPPTTPATPTIPVSTDLVTSLRSQLRSRDETIATLNRKHTREKSALQARVLTLERSLGESKKAGPSISSRYTTVASGQSPGKSKRRGASSDPSRNEVSSRGRAPSSVRSSSHVDSDLLDRIRTHVDKTTSRVSIILKQIAEAEAKRGKKKGDEGVSMAAFKKSLIASQHDLSVSKQMLNEAEGVTSGAVHKTRSSPLKIGDRRNPSPAHRGKSHKAPIPPISLTELRMRSPRLQLSPKQLVNQPLTARVPSAHSYHSHRSDGSSKTAKSRGYDFTGPRRTGSSAVLSPRPKASSVAKPI
eukprot:TRINITY_DN426_c1_g3_i1.p1 TRINITY_DN426_c1_g3~~TRINITY_DN426_c1_g3_i1.p1  ORF type:complete len:407 (+),score=42.80 TRINITY_DN426_c1_g3_i1:135-1355(+)